ncbi:MAG TPA: lipoyl(octanoyl) transferase LipB [Candidatus Binatia bacterium]|nr:lipoyl(octanoyl) transferase LipB [Candidatus Binatia bacterium]
MTTRGVEIRRLGRMEYGAALALQEELRAARLADRLPDQLLLVEHGPVYTLGRGADAADLRGADARLGVPVFRVSRGGGGTFHGPGQVIAYPIVKLCGADRDVHRYLRRLEDVIIGTCADFGVDAHRHPTATGVWVGGQAKIASIGVGIRRWVTFHGLALNVSTDLRYFEAIVPCRMPGLRLTSLAEHCKPLPRLDDVAAALGRRFQREFGDHRSEEVAA